MGRPTRHELLVQHAILESKRGTCSRLQVGAVVSRDGRILASGYNGAASGLPHCSHDCNCTYLNGYHSPRCAKEAPCTVSVHAECNAIAYAARHGLATQGATLTTTDSPCLPCAQLIVNAGITEVVYCREYRDTSGIELLIQAQIKVWSMADAGLI